MHVTLSRWIRRGDDLDGARASLGRPTWGPAAMLADLELRVGLAQLEHADAEREVAMLDAARALAGSVPATFFSRSLAVDPTGTASVLLSMRDALIEAGWEGHVVAAAGPRVEVLAALEASARLPPGRADRLLAVRRALDEARTPPFSRVALLEPMNVWPGAWRAVFERLRQRGTRVDFATPTLPGAAAETDLGRAQHALAGRPGRQATRAQSPSSPRRRLRVTGDGSLIALRASTSWELGEATASLLRVLVPSSRPRSALVVRVGDTAPLDAALVAQGLRSQGLTTSTSLRPAQQVLPLAMALLFLPRDVHHVLELFSLPVCPVPARARYALLEAIGTSAGIGNRAWTDALDAMTDEERVRVSTWIEPPGFTRGEGAPRASLLEVAQRVRAWAAGRRASAGDARAFEGLLAATAAVRAALLADGRERYRPHELDVLLASCAVATSAHQTFEEPNRPDHLDSPFGVLAPRPVVALWHAGADVATAPPEPFRTGERRALAAAGVLLPEATAVLEARAVAWRRAVLAATECLIVATPEAHLGDAQPVLPVWDEIVARLQLEQEDLGRITATAEGLREGGAAWATGGVEVATCVEPLLLPKHEDSWKLDGKAAAAATLATARLSASGVEMLLACPLRFVLERAAGLYSARVASVSDGVLLKGILGHRLIEALHGGGLLGDPEKVRAAAPAILSSLVAQEAAPLHREGRASERAQIERQLLRAAQTLSQLLVDSELTVEGVEVAVEDESEDGVLHGRIDVLAIRKGVPFVIDLKLGKSHAERLKHGLAVQLAHYGEVVRRQRKLKRFPGVAYFALGAARAYALEGTGLAPSMTSVLEGPPVEETAAAALLTTKATRALLAKGTVPVTGVGHAPRSLASSLGDRPDHLALPAESGCGYCEMGPICGRSWKGLA